MNTLKEIKSGKTGFGLLVENDGYISMNEGKNKDLFESYKLNESMDGEWHCPYPFVVSAVFQKYGVKNANGRIYPEEVLKKEVEKYQQAIQERRAYGECYTPDAMVLTSRGWKSIIDVKAGDDVLTLNTETNEIEIQSVSRKIERKHDGKLIRIKGNHINDLVTPGHGFPVYGRNHKFKGFYTAQDILDKKIPDQNHCYIPKQGVWNKSNDTDTFTIPALSEERLSKITNKTLKEKYSHDLIIPMDIWVKFMGIYLSEGSCTHTGRGHVVTIHQKKEDICESIESMLETWGIDYTKRFRKSDGKTTFNINDIRLFNYVEPLGICYNKYVPLEIKKLNVQYLRIFYDWFVMGDGRIRGDKRLGKQGYYSDDVFSSSKQLALDLNEIQLKIGYSGSFHSEPRNNDRFIEGRLIKGENCHEMFFTYRSLTKGIYLDERFIEVTEEEYNGDVMCLEVPNHTWYVMQNGKCHWTKNCNHPDSTAIDVGRICLNITELHWEGKTLVGEMEIPITENFRRTGAITCLADQVAHFLLSGLKLGVSSRGIGNVEQKYGTTIVTDYELICWDLVSQPSTPGAWIGETPEELRPYMESESKDKSKLLTDLNKFSEWLD
jgi:intein/homing endonuclease